MANSTYFPQYKAQIETEGLAVIFYRLYEDTRDPMCDSIRPDWSPVDDFRITIKKRVSKESSRYGCAYIEEATVADEFEVFTTDKQLANYIWWLAKHGTTYEQFKAMHEVKQF